MEDSIEFSRNDHVPAHWKAGNDDLGSGLDDGDEGQTRYFGFKNEITRSVHLGALELDRGEEVLY